MAERLRTPEGTQGVIDEIDALRAAKLAKRVTVIARQQGKQQLRNAVVNATIDRAMATAAKGYMAEPKGGRGKVFHTKAHDRKKGEKYYTPAWVTRCLIRVLGGRLTTVPLIVEPAAGDGKIVDELRHHGYAVEASDLTPDRFDIVSIDFFSMTAILSPAAAIITNPPFGVGGRLAFQFCWHALRLMEQRCGLVAMLLRDDFDSAKGRRKLFADHPAFDMKIVITDRIRWTNLPQDAKKGPSGSHAWFIWDWSRDPTQHTALVYASADEDPLAAVGGATK